MTRLSNPNPIQLLFISFTLLIMSACGGGSGPSLPMRPDAGGMDGGVAGISITSPADNTVVTVEDDTDGDTSNGIQLAVTVAASDAVAGTISLTVGDAPVELAEPIDGVATFQITLPADGNAAFVLTASAELTDGTTAESVATIGVQIEACALTIAPRPSSVGCAFGPAADTNAEADGVQTLFDIQANCAGLTVVQNGALPASIDVVDGAAQYEATLLDGSNELVFSLTDGFSDPVVDTLRFTANTQGGSVELNDLSETRQNRFLVADGEVDAGQVFWTVSGQTTGFEAGSTLTLNFEPAFNDAELTTTVRSDGSFRAEVAIDNGAFYEGNLNIGGDDDCGSSASSTTVAVRFDATTPILNINSPAENALLTAILDADDLRSGIQVPVEIGALDTRPNTVDYSIGVECAAVGPNPVYVERTIVESDAVLRSALNDEDPENNVAIATFQASEAGEFLCRAIIKETSNPPVNQSALWRTYFREATLNVLLPSAFPSCVSQDPFEIRAVGQNIDGNRPILFYRLTPEGGSPGQQQILNGSGNNIYTADVSNLADGRYELSFEGSILTDVPVRFEPATVDLVVNQNDPTISFITPNSGTFVDSDAITPGTQVAVELEVCGAGGQTVIVNSVPELVAGGQSVEVPSDSECATVTMPAVNVPLGSVTLTASVTDLCGVSAQATRTAAVDPNSAFAQILSLDSGDLVNAAQDTDGAQAGCQLDIRVETNGVSEGATFAVCTTALQGAADPNCLGLPSALNGDCRILGAGSVPGSSVFECPISLSDAAHQVSFVAVEGERVQSAVVNVTADCSSPQAASVTIPEDVDANGCINSRERLQPNGAAATGEFTVQIQTSGLEDGTRVDVRDQSGTLFGFGLVSGGTATVTGSMAETQTDNTLSITASDAVGNDLVGQDGGAVSLTVRTDTTTPSLVALNLDSLDCLGIAEDEDNARPGLQFTPQLDVTSSAGELVTVNVSIDGINFSEGPALISRVGLNQFSLPEGAHRLQAVVSDGCGNQGSAYGFEQVNGNDDWNSPVSNDFSIDTVAPIVRLANLMDGAVFQPEDDADGNSANGFQVSAAISVDALAPLEAGQEIAVLANGNPASTIPSPLLMGADPSADQTFTLTLAGGPQAMTVAAQDACGNQSPAQSAVTVTLDVNGCPSRFNGFVDNPQILNASAGQVLNGALQLDIAAQVDIFNAGCEGGTAQLLVDDNVVRSVSVPADGLLNFAGISLAPGSRNLRLRVSAGGLDTVDSQTQVVTIDIATPAITFVSPTNNTAILTDADGSSDNGQQVTIIGNVTEDSVATQRTVTLSIDGAAADSVVIGNGASEQVNFVDQTLTSGTHTLQLCVADEASDAVCESIQVNADPAAPGALTNVQATIRNARSSSVELAFTAPGDDGTDGVVAGYEIRRVVKADPNASVTVAEWDAASASSLIVNDTTASGGPVTVDISGVGPGSTTGAHGPLAAGLVPNQLHTLAIAAIDDATDLEAGASHPRLGSISDITVDLTWRSETYDIPRSSGAWAGGGLSGQASPITAAGDVDNSGHGDVVVTYWTFQGGFQTAAHLVLGHDDPSNATSSPLVFPAELAFVVASAGGQDVNGDAIPDIVLGGFNAAFTSGTVAVYLGCDLATDCDLATLTTADAVFTLPGRLLNGVNLIGNFHQRTGDSSAFADILVGGSSLPGGTETTAWVIAGRSAWANVAIQTANDVPSDNANNTNGVTTLQTTTAVPGQSAAAIGDLNNDGFVEIAVSGGTSPGFVHVIEGGANLGGRVSVDASTLTGVPSCMREVGANESVGFGHDIEGGIDLNGVAGGDFVVSNLEGVVAVMSQDLGEVDCFTFGGPYRFGQDTSLAGDLNGDGHQDLVVSHGLDNNGPSVPTETNAYVFLNDGNGQFGIPYNTGIQRRAHMRLDAITVTSGGPNFESGLSGVSGIGDFNGDATSDIGAVIKQTGSGSLQLVIYY